MRKLRVLEAFAGTECISNAFREHGHECFTIDWDEKFPSSMHCDIGQLKLEDLPEEFRHPDVFWAAPDCRSYSLAAISKHRVKNPITGNLDPISDYAKKSDEVDQHLLALMKEMNPTLWFIENPRACLQNMTWMKPLDEYKHLITYCQYSQELPIEQRRMKPTNIWTNHPDPQFKPPCKPKMNCHISAPRGSKTGTQGMRGAEERSTYPKALCEYIVKISEEYIDNLERSTE